MPDVSKTSLAGCKVLVVEDEALVLMLIEDMLLALDCEVVAQVMRVQDALALAGDASRAIDIAILDVNLAGERSADVAEALDARGCPFVLATGYDDDGIEPRWRDRPILRKPFMMLQLEQALKAALSATAV